METSTRAPFAGAWSPLGYQVVELTSTDASIPPRPQGALPTVPRQPGGFQAVLVAEETVPPDKQEPFKPGEE